MSSKKDPNFLRMFIFGRIPKAECFMKKPHDDSQVFLKKAQEDEALLVLLKSNLTISDAIYGFHAQQAAEKLMKCVLTFHGVIFPKTHDLSMLLDLLLKSGINVPVGEIAHVRKFQKNFVNRHYSINRELSGSSNQWCF